MKIKGFIITGILLVLVGAGICTIAATRDDFDIHNVYVDPSLEQKKVEFQEIEKITYEGKADYVIVKKTEEANSLVYYEGKHMSYTIDYIEESKELIIKQDFRSNGFHFHALSKGNKPIILNLNQEIEDMNLDLNAGKITLENINARSLSIDINAGDIEVRNSTFANLDIDIDAGDIRFQGDILTQASLSINAGYLKMVLEREKEIYKINGKGNGDVQILFDIDAGSSSFTYKE